MLLGLDQGPHTSPVTRQGVSPGILETGRDRDWFLRKKLANSSKKPLVGVEALRTKHWVPIRPNGCAGHPTGRGFSLKAPDPWRRGTPQETAGIGKFRGSFGGPNLWVLRAKKSRGPNPTYHPLGGGEGHPQPPPPGQQPLKKLVLNWGCEVAWCTFVRCVSGSWLQGDPYKCFRNCKE